MVQDVLEFEDVSGIRYEVVVRDVDHRHSRVSCEL